MPRVQHHVGVLHALNNASAISYAAVQCRLSVPRKDVTDGCRDLSVSPFGPRKTPPTAARLSVSPFGPPKDFRRRLRSFSVAFRSSKGLPADGCASFSVAFRSSRKDFTPTAARSFSVAFRSSKGRLPDRSRDNRARSHGSDERLDTPPPLTRISGTIWRSRTGTFASPSTGAAAIAGGVWPNNRETSASFVAGGASARTIRSMSASDSRPSCAKRSTVLTCSRNTERALPTRRR